MFFIMGIMPIQKDIPYMLSSMCKKCGSMCHYQIFMTASCLSIFFIPLFKFSKKYFVKAPCCGALYQLDKKVGDSIAKGENTIIQDDDLTLISENFEKINKCPVCGYEYTEDFEFCPKCGAKLK